MTAAMQRHATRPRFEQEPLSRFRRDVIAEDEFRIRVEAIAAELLREERIALAWAVRRILNVGTTYVAARRCIDWSKRIRIEFNA